MLFPGALIASAAVLMTGMSQIPTLEEIHQLPAVRELPDPFLKPDGERVRTAQEWEARRRQLLEQILRYEYGPLPPEPGRVVVEEIATRILPGTDIMEKELVLRTGPDLAVRTRLLLFIPPGEGPFPVVVRGDLCWGRISTDIVTQIARRGYALADFDRVDIAPDSAERAGVYRAYPDYRGGRLAAWAWGYHRVIDYLVTLPYIDVKRIIVTGHSRGGKTALLAGATDQRIALTAPNNSGCGGAGCYRFQGEGSEDIAAILRNFPFWFQPHFHAFIGQVERLPFDQHTLKALIAPRALLSTEALGDLWANPSGSQITYQAAREVYTFLGASDRIGIVFRQGPHEHNADDWNALLDFADWQLAGKTVARRFNQLAFPDLPLPYTWRAPTRIDAPHTP
ncbi:MAG: hypothetical protein NZ557_06400 [Chthonomonadaceae bacterium]|nr:hypothetical protein [Chthonomonadaceae bacterium]